MKTLLVSDIHSNIVALEAVWKRERDSDLVVCAGDLVDYGPNPVEVIDWFRNRRVPTVVGNHDQGVVRAFRRPDLHSLDPSETRWQHHNARLLSQDRIDYLESLPESLVVQIDAVTWGLRHMYVDYTTIETLYQFETLSRERFGARVKNILLGHTHRQAIHELATGCVWVNPGSVSYRRPDDPDQCAHYAVIIDGKVELRRVEYDLSVVLRATDGVQLHPHQLLMTGWFFGPRRHTMSTPYPEWPPKTE